MYRTFPAILAVLCLVSSAVAHPVPNENHDRFILVRLTPTAVIVDCRLEVDESRAGLDLPQTEVVKIKSRDDLHATFCRYFGDVLAGNLVGELDGQALNFHCVSHRYTLRDEVNRPLGHLRCEYRMEAAWAPDPNAVHTFKFRESNYELEDFNRLQLALTVAEGVVSETVVAPDAALLARKPADFQPNDGERLREVSATFRLVPVEPRGVSRASLPPDIIDLKSEPEGAAAIDKPAAPGADVSADKPKGEPPSEEHSWSLLHLLLNTEQGVGVLLLAALAFGAAHALTPGHGKTLVAAYLVGDRGTTWHALLLGLTTTITHTAAVLVIATGLLFFPTTNPALVTGILELAGGVLLFSLGFWLLYTRLTGRADHFHVGGGHHHHDHDHDHHHPELTANDGAPPSVWALLILGVKGGMVPCWDAIAMLAFAISAGKLWLGLPLLLAFSAGLAGVLTGLGIGVVHARNFAGRRFGDGERFRRVVRALPLFSAATAIMLVGLWLCYASLHP